MGSIIIGLIGGLIVAIIKFLISVQAGITLSDIFKIGLLLGLIAGFLRSFIKGMLGSTIEKRTIPNQGIRKSIYNASKFALIGGLVGAFFGLVVLLIDQRISGLVYGLSIGVSIGSISGGGQACIEHFILRSILYCKKRIPWNYAKFLDFCAGCKLMKKIGGGYVFYHRMLLEHFAQMKGSGKFII